MSTFHSAPTLTQAKVCHIHKLPNELLAAVFEEHLFLHPQAPFIDSRVCRRWRETALLYPKLWSSIIISRSNKRPSLSLKASFSRSRDRPITISFKYPQLTHEERTLVNKMLFSSKGMASRIKSLCFEDYFTALPKNGVLCNLRALHLKAWRYGETNIPLDRQHLPSLEELILNGVSSPNLPMGAFPPLRYLLLSGVQDSAWMLLLSGCSDTLVELIVHNCHFRQVGPCSTVYLPKLRYLALFDSLSHYSGLFHLRSYLAAPNLSVIHEQPNYRIPFSLRMGFPSVVEYACRSELLTLDENVFAERLVVERMALMGPLDGLRKIFRLIALYPHHLPRLSTIELITPDGNPITDQQWLELLGLLTGTPLSTTLKLQPMPRLPSVLLPFSGIFLPFHFPMLDLKLP
jgi:F-box-like